MVWSSLITVDAMQRVMKLDTINVPYPNRKVPRNLVFATKMSLGAFLISAHAFDMMAKKRGLKVNSNFQGKIIRQTFISNCEK